MSEAISKRYRQINIKESFALAKKARINSDTSTMEQNLRDLMAAAALKRREESENRGKINNSRTPDTNKFEALAGSTEPPSNQVLPKDIEENCIPSTSRDIDNSGELFPESPVVEQCSSQEKNSQTIIESQSGSSNSGESPMVEEYDTEVDTGPEDNEFAMLLNRIPDCSPPLPRLEPLDNHSIMFSPHVRPNDAPRPYPSSYKDKWNENHVRMPCSPESKFPVEDQFGTKRIVSRWDLICGSLRRRILTSQDLEEAIMAYNTQYRGKWNFDGLHTFFDTCLSDTEREYYFETVLPRMVEAALNLPNVCTQPIPLLKKRRDHYVTISQKQISCLLLNAFFCTYPRRNNIFRGSRNVSSEYASYPDINFNRLFSGRRHRMSSTLQKLMCLFNYFRRVTLNEPTGTVTFHRQYLTNLPKWNESEKRIRNAFVRHDGLIEADGLGLLQVDFANRFVGGGVLATGCIQEEIRFVICPELIVSRLFVESLTPNEALIITGVEQYNSYSGYGDTFKWKGDYQDGTVRDAWGRRCTEVVAINATAFNVPSEQYKTFYVETELEKAYCGFYKGYAPAHLSAIATGNWGCGAFKGDPHLKFLIQLMAASEVGRDLLYFTFGNKTLKKDLKKIYDLFQDKNLAVGDIFRILKDYSLTMKLVKNEPSPKLLEYLCFLFSSDEDTDIENSNPTPAITDSDQHAIQRLIEDVEKEGSDAENTQPSNPS